MEPLLSALDLEKLTKDAFPFLSVRDSAELCKIAHKFLALGFTDKLCFDACMLDSGFWVASWFAHHSGLALVSSASSLAGYVLIICYCLSSLSLVIVALETLIVVFCPFCRMDCSWNWMIKLKFEQKFWGFGYPTYLNFVEPFYFQFGFYSLWSYSACFDFPHMAQPQQTTLWKQEGKEESATPYVWLCRRMWELWSLDRNKSSAAGCMITNKTWSG